MYVCLCKQVTCADIRNAASNGATRLRDLSQTMGVATQCGKCARCAHDLLKQCTSRR
ncbi:MAG: (2Fe-2S)-binding protein [Pseudomonadota bacterium]